MNVTIVINYTALLNAVERSDDLHGPSQLPEVNSVLGCSATSTSLADNFSADQHYEGVTGLLLWLPPAFGTSCRLQSETLLPSPFLNLG